MDRSEGGPDPDADGRIRHGDRIGQAMRRGPGRLGAAVATAMIAVLVAATEARQASPATDRSAVLSEARALINQAQPVAAIAKLTPLDAPGRSDVALLLGVAYYHANNHRQAIDHLAPIADTLPGGS